MIRATLTIDGPVVYDREFAHLSHSFFFQDAPLSVFRPSGLGLTRHRLARRSRQQRSPKCPELLQRRSQWNVLAQAGLRVLELRQRPQQ